MEPSISTITPFTASNVKKCICGSCPVQMNSQCIKEKHAAVKESLKKNPLQAVDIPGPVFTDYQLATHQPMGYYCRDGMAT